MKLKKIAALACAAAVTITTMAFAPLNVSAATVNYEPDYELLYAKILTTNNGMEQYKDFGYFSEEYYDGLTANECSFVYTELYAMDSYAPYGMRYNIYTTSNILFDAIGKREGVDFTDSTELEEFIGEIGDKYSSLGEYLATQDDITFEIKFSIDYAGFVNYAMSGLVDDSNSIMTDLFNREKTINYTLSMSDFIADNSSNDINMSLLPLYLSNLQANPIVYILYTEDITDEFDDLWQLCKDEDGSLTDFELLMTKYERFVIGFNVNSITPIAPVEIPEQPPVVQAEEYIPEVNYAIAISETMPDNTPIKLNGYATIESALNAAGKAPNVRIDGSKVKYIPKELLDTVKNSRKTSSIEVRYTDLKVKIEKDNITNEEALLDLSFDWSRSPITKSISEKFQSAAVVKGVSFANKGDFGGVEDVHVSYRIGRSYIGRDVTVYKIVNNKPVLLGKSVVDATGFASIDIDDYSSLIFVVE